MEFADSMDLSEASPSTFAGNKNGVVPAHQTKLKSSRLQRVAITQNKEPDPADESESRMTRIAGYRWWLESRDVVIDSKQPKFVWKTQNVK